MQKSRVAGRSTMIQKYNTGWRAHSSGPLARQPFAMPPGLRRRHYNRTGAHDAQRLPGRQHNADARPCCRIRKLLFLQVLCHNLTRQEQPDVRHALQRRRQGRRAAVHEPLPAQRGAMNARR